MTSPKKTAANRRNAAKSTGPKSKEGKAFASMNAVKHGLTASLRPLPTIENGEAWEGHLAQTVEALDPMGYMEAMLAERVAVQSWRLGRVIRMESETAALAQEQVEQNIMDREAQSSAMVARLSGTDQPILRPQTTAELREDLKHARGGETILDNLKDKPAGKVLDMEGTMDALFALADKAGIDFEDENLPAVRGINPNPGFLEIEKWTAGKLRAVANALAGNREGGGEMLIFDAWLDLSMEAATAANRLAKRERAEAKARAQNILVDWPTLQNITRYESHLERSMMNTLHELQRLQAKRAGNPVLAPVAIDLNTNAGG